MPGVKLPNDLAATVCGRLHPGSEDLVELQRGLKRRGNMAAAAGTGLDVAILAWDGTG